MPTTSKFSVSNFYTALCSANPRSDPVMIQDLLVQQLWSPSFYFSENSELSGWSPMATTTVPGVTSQTLVAISIADLIHRLVHVGGMPKNEFLQKICATVPAELDSDREDIAKILRATPLRDYPKDGRIQLAAIILPFRRLRQFCEIHSLAEPLILTEHLGRGYEVIPEASTSRGRPSKHATAVEHAFRERVKEGINAGTPMAEAKALRAWLKGRLEAESRPTGENDLPREETIRNNLLKIYDFDTRQFIGTAD
ncbi:hypothetical protein [Paramagnetospirillum kuznetsovii]|nr:hypothetical protein [Paramagnetospirillum kuznetsovii]